MRGFFLGRRDSIFKNKACKRADCSRMLPHSVSPQAWASSNECSTVLREARLQAPGGHINSINNFPSIYSSNDRTNRSVQGGDQLGFSHNGLLQTPLQHLDSAAPTTQALTYSLAEMRPAEDIPVYVMLPLDTVNADGVFRYAYIPWFAQALQVLALSGVHGVAVDIWWCAVEHSPRQYNWTGYKQLFEMVRGIGLKLQVVLSFHACGGNVGDLAQIPLPPWVLEAGLQDPDIFFTDRPRETGLGQRNKEYLSIWADECQVLPCGSHGTGARRTPLQAYGEFMAAFRSEFQEQLGSLIEEVVIGTGPCGELRYPSYFEANGWRFPGVGEFQCYDRRALASLAAAATALGRPEWGYAGPHDSGGYNSSPGDTGFFAPGGSWDTEYGNFFLGWYSSCLLQHGERLLQIANQVFGPHKTPKQPPQGPLAQAQAVMRRLQSLVLGNSNTSNCSADGSSSCSSSANNLAAVAAAATVAAAAAAGGMSGDANSVAAAALQARGLLQQVQELQQQQHAATPGFLAGRMSSSSCSDDDAGSSTTFSPTLGSLGSAMLSSSSAGTSAGCLNTQGSLSMLPPLPERRPQDEPQQQQQQQVAVLGSLAPFATCSQPAAGAAAASVWDQLTTPQAQALATSILQQLQLHSNGGTGSSLALMAADPSGVVNASSSRVGANTAHAGQAAAATIPCAAAAEARSAAPNSVGNTSSGTTPTVSSISSSSAQDLDLAGLLSASQQHLAKLSFECTNGSRTSDMSSSSPRAAAAPAATTAAAHVGRPQLATLQLPHSNSSGSVSTAAAAAAAPAQTGGTGVAYVGSGSDVSMSIPAAAPNRVLGAAGPSPVPLASAAAPVVAAVGATASAAAAAAAAASGIVGACSSSSMLMASVSAGSLAGLGTAAASDGPGSMDCSSYSPESSGTSSSPLFIAPAGATAAVAAVAATAGAVGAASTSLLHMFLEALSGVGLDVSGKPGRQQLQQPQHQRRRQQQQRLIVTLKIAGVHWWYNSTSHASELTAGYYNTDSRDGYSPILLLCEKYDVNLTLTCVEMCDAQHPSYALCGPEGLLRQIRAMAAKQGVSLSGENALPIFTPGGVDAVALDRVVSNVRSCRAAPLRSCSSWPGPATTSGSSDAYCESTGGNVMRNISMSAYHQQGANYMGFNHHQQQSSSNSSRLSTDMQQHSSSNAKDLSSSNGMGTSRCFRQQQQQRQQHAYHHHYGAGMGGVSNILSTGRTFSELGTLLTYDTAAAAAAAAGNGSNGGGASSSSGWQPQQGHDAKGKAPCSNTAAKYGSAGHPGSSGKDAASAAVQHSNANGDVLLPAMRAFTFLRLGPEILQPECHASWMRFMHRMLNERA